MENLARVDDGWGVVRAIQRALAYSMLVGSECAFVAERDGYDRLLERLSRTRLLTIVTLNYDILLEDALKRRGIRITYPSVPGVEGTIFTSEGSGAVVPVYKPHGSINWLAIRSIGLSASLEVAQTNTKPLKLTRSGPYLATQSHATYVPPNRTSIFHELETRPVVSGPAVAVYGVGKYVVENPDHVQSHRAHCLTQLGSMADADVLAIGVRPASFEDDPVLSGLLDAIRKIQGHKEYVSPDGADCAAFRQRGFTSKQMTFEGWLSQPVASDGAVA
jgi:hypothetical protein